jgi:5-methylcytosine-specific restriction endonuclease McrA
MIIRWRHASCFLAILNVLVRHCFSFISITPTRTQHSISYPRSLPTKVKIEQLSRLLSTKGDKEATNYTEILEEIKSDKLYGLGSLECELGQFVNWLQDGRLNLFPEYQRDFVWKAEKSSRLIVTVLCNRLVPPIVIHERNEGEFDVVDGKQRLTTLLGFYLNGKDTDQKNFFALDSSLLRVLPDLRYLSKLGEDYEQLNGLCFDDLDQKYKRKYKSYSLTYVKIPYGTRKSDVFEVYDDINSGGQNLNPQQIRRAVYFGPYIRLLDDIAVNCTDFHAINNPKVFQDRQVYSPCAEHSDRELILRAFAFKNIGNQFKTPLKKFLNRELEGSDDSDTRDESDKRRLEARMKQQETEFLRTMKIARLIFDDRAFRKPYPTAGGDKLSMALWDAGYFALSELIAEGFKDVEFMRSKSSILHAFKQSYQSGFFAQDNHRTQTSRAFLARKDEYKRLIRNALESSTTRLDQKRSFSESLRIPLYDKQKGLCPLCGEKIDPDRLRDGKYVHIDHVIPHIMGGQTAEDNAQLVHSVCNLVKGSSMVNGQVLDHKME